MKKRVILLFLVFSGSLFGQHELIDSLKFNDQEAGENAYMYAHFMDSNDVYLAIAKGNNTSPPTGIVKVDSSGKTLWSTFDDTSFSNNHEVLQLGFMNNEHIYAWSTNGNYEYLVHIISKSTGQVIHTDNTPGYTNSNMFMTDYDDSTYFTINEAYYFSGPDDSLMVHEIDKTNGQVRDTFSYISKSKNFGITHDLEGNILLWAGSKITKYNGRNLKEKLWQGDYSQIDSNQLDFFDQLKVNSEGRLFAVGAKADNPDNRYFCEINIHTGKMYYASGANLFNRTKAVNLLEDLDHMYITFTHLYVGGGVYSRYFTVKYKKDDGQIVWESTEQPTPVGVGGPPAFGNNNGPNDIAIDCQGNLIISGYYGSTNYSPTNYGLIKIDGSSGDKLYDFTITQDSSTYDRWSNGRVSAFFDTRAVTIGNEQQIGTNDRRVVFVGFENPTGQITRRHNIGLVYQYPSWIIDMVQIGDTIFTLKQVGDSLEALCEINGQQEWRKEFGTNKYPRNALLHKGAKHLQIVFTEHEKTPFIPHFDSIPSAIVSVKIDAGTGQILNQNSRNLPSGHVDLIELQSDSLIGNIILNIDQTPYVFGILANGNFSNLSPLNLDLISNYSLDQNRLSDFSVNQYSLVLDSGLFTCQKNDLNTPILSFLFSTNFDVQNHQFIENQLWVMGQLDDTVQYFCVYNTNDGTVIFEDTLQAGTLKFLKKDPYGNTIIFGMNDRQFHAYSFTKTFEPLWQYSSDSSATGRDVLLRDVAVIETGSSIALAGLSSEKNKQHLILKILDFYGNEIFQFDRSEVNFDKTFSSSVVGSANTFLLGGAYNQNVTSKDGVLYTIKSKHCDRYLDGDSATCINDSATLTAWSGTSYQWLRNGVPISGETNASLSITQFGLYNVIVEDSCGIDSMIQPVFKTIHMLPPVSINIPEDTVCTNEPEFQVSGSPQGGFVFGDGVVGTNFNPQINGSGEYQLFYLYQDSAGCEATDSVYLTVFDTSFSSVSTVELDSFAYADTVYFQSGTYTHIFKNIYGCDSIVSLNLTIVYTASLTENSNGPLHVFPNPTKGKIWIQGLKENQSTVELISMEGQIIARYKCSKSETELDLPLISPGMYFIKVGEYIFKITVQN